MEEQELKNISNITQGLVNGSPWVLQQAETLTPKVVEKLNKAYEGNIFVPNKSQMSFLRAIFHPASGNCVEDWLSYGRCTKDEFDAWKEQVGFQDWLVAEGERRFAFYKLEALKIGVQKMQHDVKTWQTMVGLLFPYGITRNPAEKGSRRASLEAEAKRIFETKNVQK